MEILSPKHESQPLNWHSNDDNDDGGDNSVFSAILKRHNHLGSGKPS